MIRIFKHRTIRYFCIVAVAFSTQGFAGSDHADTDKITALKCGKLLDVEQYKVLKDRTVLVQGERIIAINKGSTIPQDAEVIDLSDHYCLPGLMDMHYHPMAYPGQGKYFSYSKKRSSAEYALIGASSVEEALHHGFTTLRIPGHPPDPEYALIDLRNAINEGLLKGPRLFVAPHGLFKEGAFDERIETLSQQIQEAKEGTEKEDLEAGLSVWKHFQQAKAAQLKPGQEGMREGVRRQIAHGADWIKIHLDTGGMLGSDITENSFTHDELHALVDETHRLNKRVVVGAHGDVASLAATMAGADSVDHGLYISESTADLMKEKGTYLVPTLTIFNDFVWLIDHEHSNLNTFERHGQLPYFKAQEKTIRKEHKARSKSFQYAYKIGVNIANGSDQFTIMGALREFTHLVDQGVSHWDAIAMGTMNSARLLGMEQHIGSIAVGKYADIVAMPDNPLDHIEAIQQINFVMKNGELIRHD